MQTGGAIPAIAIVTMVILLVAGLLLILFARRRRADQVFEDRACDAARPP
ncbi:LPXTG cell wall anchor domain-containing protein [Microbacterium sp. BLY]|nr:LPXTG cell wall anchor domain-containing protein [Microbacterium sp. BLY]MBP3976926.1 LPXTG cell wall anchor domain-containing protein [Microbacterium sp. BLY]